MENREDEDPKNNSSKLAHGKGSAYNFRTLGSISEALLLLKLLNSKMSKIAIISSMFFLSQKLKIFKYRLVLPVDAIYDQYMNCRK